MSWGVNWRLQAATEQQREDLTWLIGPGKSDRKTMNKWLLSVLTAAFIGRKRGGMHGFRVVEEGEGGSFIGRRRGAALREDNITQISMTQTESVFTRQEKKVCVLCTQSQWKVSAARRFEGLSGPSTRGKLLADWGPRSRRRKPRRGWCKRRI